MSLLHEKHPFKGPWRKFFLQIWGDSGDGSIFYLRPWSTERRTRFMFEAILQGAHVSSRYHNYAMRYMKP